MIPADNIMTNVEVLVVKLLIAKFSSDEISPQVLIFKIYFRPLYYIKFLKINIL